MYSDYLTWKKKYSNSVVLIKSGFFYRTYDNDTIILSYLCCYKVIKNVLVFPIRSLSKVLKKLKWEEVNFVVDNDVHFSFENDDNYLTLLNQSLEVYKLRVRVDKIYDYLNGNIERKFIKKVIDEIEEIINER